MKLCDIWRVLRPGKYDFYVLICVLTMVNRRFYVNLNNSWNFKRKAVQFFCSWRKLNYGRRMLDCLAWAPYTQEIHSYFASNGKFVTSLNKVLLVTFLLLFIHSFQVASDFSVNPTKPY